MNREIVHGSEYDKDHDGNYEMDHGMNHGKHCEHFDYTFVTFVLWFSSQSVWWDYEGNRGGDYGNGFVIIIDILVMDPSFHQMVVIMISSMKAMKWIMMGIIEMLPAMIMIMPAEIHSIFINGSLHNSHWWTLWEIYDSSHSMMSFVLLIMESR